MFKRKKKSAPKTLAVSPAREALREVNEQLVVARKAFDAAQVNVNRLHKIIDDAAPAHRNVHQAVAQDGGEALARFAAAGAGEFGALLDAADHAARAAAIAREALPGAERALDEARIEVANREDEKVRRIRQVLIEHGDALATRYRQCFAELGSLHDELVAFAQGARASEIQLSPGVIEVPRFNLPSLKGRPPSAAAAERGYSLHGLRAGGDDGYSPFLRHVPDANKIAQDRAIWMRFFASLEADPAAEMKEFGEPIPSTEQKAPALIIHPKRERAPEPDVNVALYGQ
jgi:hypothetical protein